MGSWLLAVAVVVGLFAMGVAFIPGRVMGWIKAVLAGIRRFPWRRLIFLKR
jgi:hypothetical protein